MKRYLCKTHGVTLIIEGKVRRIMPPPGSFGNPCHLLTDFKPKEGKFDNCEIEEVGR